MRITEEQIKAAHKSLKNENGGAWQDYFGLLFLEEFHKVPREQALHQVAFGGEDYGIDGYHFDKAKRHIYLFQFKWSSDHEQFKQGFRTLLEHGMGEVFGANANGRSRNAVVNGLKNVLRENRSRIDHVSFHFVFTGEPEKAENSSVLGALREDLENRKHMLDEWWGKEMSMVIEYRSLSGKRSHVVVDKTHEYPIKLSGSLEKDGPDGQQMVIGMGRLYDIYGMFRQMGSRFFERNIRHSLPEDGSVNRVLLFADCEAAQPCSILQTAQAGKERNTFFRRFLSSVKDQSTSHQLHRFCFLPKKSLLTKRIDAAMQTQSDVRVLPFIDRKTQYANRQAPADLPR